MIWIEVETRTPPENEHVLIATKDFVIAALYSDGNFYLLDMANIIYSNVTHWMCFPSHPHTVHYQSKKEWLEAVHKKEQEEKVKKLTRIIEKAERDALSFVKKNPSQMRRVLF